MKNASLKRRIIEISYKHKLSHIGSCLTAVDIVDEIYALKKPDEKFVLSSGHAGLALYCVIEKYSMKALERKHKTPFFLEKLLDAEKIFKHHGVHPDRCEKCHLDCSAGSLGQGLPIAVGMALADRSKNVYCLISDGEAAEGSIWEALRIKNHLFLDNLKVYCNWNGWAAYNQTFADVNHDLKEKGVIMRYTQDDALPFLKGQSAHYVTMTEGDYKVSMEVLG